MRWKENLARIGAVVLALCAMLRGFDAAYLAYRLTPVAVPPDSLIHYNGLLWWVRFGDSPRGFTLTPSPYLIDVALQLPMSVLVPNFEHFSYRLGEIYALMFLVTLYMVLRYALATTRLVAFVIACLGVIGYYHLAEWGLYEHAFMANHTSLVPATLAVVALVFALFRPEAKPRRLAPLYYVLALFVCVLSDPFAIGTYCVPACCAATALLGTPAMRLRRLIWFVALTGIATIAGLVALALMARYIWPVRGDNYAYTATQSLHLVWKMVTTVDGMWRITILAVVGAAASTALFFIGRRKGTLNAPALFMLAYLPTCLVACVVLPIKRGAFDSPYALRYITLPWLLITTLFAAFVVLGVNALVKRSLRDRAMTIPRWGTHAAAGGLAAVGLVTVLTGHGPVKMFSQEATTGAMLRCVNKIERNAQLQDGLGDVYIARFVNAARLSSYWHSPYVVVQVYESPPPFQNARESNVLWYNDDVWRQGRAKINWFATHNMPDVTVQSVRDTIGEPDQIHECPSPVDMRPDAKPTFQIWVWDRPDAQQRLAELMTRNNMRSPFSPAIGKTRMPIDMNYGMYTDAKSGQYLDGHRLWRRGEHLEGHLAYIRHFWVPSGRYRIELDLASVPRTPTSSAVAELVVHMERRTKPIAQFPIPPGATRHTFELDIDNFGGATSGDLLWMYLHTRDAERLDLSSMTLVLVEPKGIDPFRIFR
jgi:hypothetical protein